MYVDLVPNRTSPPAVLLRQSFRRGDKVLKRTLANLSDWPPQKVDLLRHLLKDDPLLVASQDVRVQRSLPHGHVAAALGTLRRLGLQTVLNRTRCPERDVVVAMIVARILAPSSKLATTRLLREETAASSLGSLLGLETVDEDRLYAALDWLLARQGRIEKALAKHHLQDGSLVLYDLTSTYFEGRHCPLARFGHSRDERSGNPQIVFGLLTTREGCPLAVEVFEGNTGDPKTVAAQVKKLREQFRLSRLVLVGDRGMLTSARIREDLKGQEGLQWITALRSVQIRQLVSSGALQLSLFDVQNLAEVEDPSYPGERLIACRNPLLAEERSRKRRELLEATEKYLNKIVTATQRKRKPLRGRKEIGLAVGKILGRHKMGKHFRLFIEDESFRWERKIESIEKESALDGLYVIRTSVPAEVFSSEQVVGHYKGLSEVERAFRSLKSVDLKVRPIYHHDADRVRAHVFLCMLAYYVEWHMRQALAPVLFDDEEPEAGQARRASVVEPAQRSASAENKALEKHTAEGLPVHSFQTLLKDLATLTKNRLEIGGQTIEMSSSPTLLQQRAFELLQVPALL